MEMSAITRLLTVAGILVAIAVSPVVNSIPAQAQRMGGFHGGMSGFRGGMVFTVEWVSMVAFTLASITSTTSIITTGSSRASGSGLA
jgi:hypothetical protein